MRKSILVNDPLITLMAPTPMQANNSSILELTWLVVHLKAPTTTALSSFSKLYTTKGA